MAVFRIEKNRDYTVMSNHHLRNAGLSLKSKGLLSMMLSLPEDWNYTTRGLAKICKEGTDSIGSALKELEQAGYIVRNRLRDSKGKIVDVEYVIYETPHPLDTGQPCADEPDTACPDPENPDMDNPCLENRPQLNKEKRNPEEPNTDLPSTEGLNPIRGQQHLGFLVALAFQKTLLHQFFNSCGSGCRGADALPLHALRHTVCTCGFHSVQQGVL